MNFSIMTVTWTTHYIICFLNGQHMNVYLGRGIVTVQN